mgnify:CR=1 FL=1
MKAPLPIVVTLSGMSIVLNAEQPLNVSSSMHLTLLGMATELRLVQ